MRFSMYFRGALLAALCMAGFPSVAVAFEVSPAITEVDVNAGDTVERYLNITNPEKTPLSVVFTVQKFVAAGDGTPAFLPPSDTAGLPEWFRLSARELVVLPGETERVRVQLRIPKEARAGGYYAAIFTTRSPNRGGAVGIGARIATLWMVRVQAASSTLAETAKWVVDAPVVKQEGPWWRPVLTIYLDIENMGAVHGALASTISVRGLTLRCSPTKSDVIRALPSERRGLLLATCHSILPIHKLHIEFSGTTPEGANVMRSWSVWSVTRSVLMAYVLTLVGLIACLGCVWRIRKKRGILNS